MTEQRYETGSAGPQPDDDRTQQLRTVDVLGEEREPFGDDEQATRALPVTDPATSAETGSPERPEQGAETSPPQAPRAEGGSAASGGTSPGSGAHAAGSGATPDGGPSGTPTLPTTPPRRRTGPPRAASRSAASAARSRRARLRLRRVDPLSVFLLALLLSLFLAIVIVVAVVALYAVLSAAGVPETINQLFAEVTRASGDTAAQAEPLLTARRAVTAAGVVAAVDVVLLTALATLGAFLYNLCASFTGGLEVTLAEPEER